MVDAISYDVTPEDESPGRRPSRRTVLQSAAWSVPVLTVAIATPAVAASAQSTISTSFANMTPRLSGSSLADGTALVKSANGLPVPGERVTFTVTGPAYFGTPGVTSYTTATNSAGVATATGLTAAAAAGTVALTATAAGIAPASATIGVINSVTFGFTGGDQTFTVPPGVTSLAATVTGAGGGKSSYDSVNFAGRGGGAYGVVAVTPGQRLIISVGGVGQAGPGGSGTYGGGGAGGTGTRGLGGAGGGLSAVWTGASFASEPYLVAGGGGGMSGAGGSNPSGGTGGGSNGGTGASVSGGGGGRGGSQTAGGVGGGGNATVGKQYSGGVGSTGADGGGGGGGGWFGGGGGRAQPLTTGDNSDGGGGGGSGYFSSNPSLTQASIALAGQPAGAAGQVRLVLA